MVLGVGVQQQTATPALADLLSQYASILASQVRALTTDWLAPEHEVSIR